MRRKIFRILIPSVIILVFLIFVCVLIDAFSLFDSPFRKHYSATEAIGNFNKKEIEIYQLVSYFRQLKPSQKEISFSVNGSRFSLGIGEQDWAIDPKYPRIWGTDLKLNAAKTDTLIQFLGWNKDNIKDLQKKLESANCKNIMSEGSVVNITYRTDDICSFEYIIYDKPVSDSMTRVYKEAGIRLLRKNVKLAIPCIL